MPHRHKNISRPVSENRPEELQPYLTVPPLPVPEGFRGYVDENQISDLEKRDRKTILALSKMEQWTDWQTEILVELWEHVRRLDVENARRILEYKSLKAKSERDGWTLLLIKWSAAVIVAGIISSLIKTAFGK